jgi:hypothetical protein
MTKNKPSLMNNINKIKSLNIIEKALAWKEKTKSTQTQSKGKSEGDKR